MPNLFEVEERERAEIAGEAKREARSILHAMRRGVDFSDVFEMSLQTKIDLAAFCVEHPEEAYIVRQAIEHRAAVKRYVDEMLQQPEQDANGEEAEETDLPAESPVAEAAMLSICSAEEYDPPEGEAQEADWDF